MEKYKNSLLTVEERALDLLSRMTLKEKIGQLNQKIYGWHAYKRTGGGFQLSTEFKEEIAFGDGVGALYGLFRAGPWSGVTFENGIPMKDSARVANMIQQYVLENTRLGIPVLISEECPHGHQALDGTVLPTNIGMGSTWNPELCEEAFSHVAAEIRSRGANLALVSSLDILQDPRWGRSEECYGEDPYLASRMTEAVVKGLQGKSLEDLKSTRRIAAVLKHFCAQGATAGGHNGKSAPIGERELREIHLPGMKAGARAGAAACMAAYNEIDGILCHGNKKLLTGILRDEWGFEGIVMSDAYGIDGLMRLTGDSESAAALALTAGVDLNLWGESFTRLESAVKNGKVSEDYIDRAVGRILRLKFLLGLFERRFTDETAALSVVGSMDFRQTNLEVARETVVLLKNDKNILPLRKDLKKIAVIGPNADNIYNQLGDYTAPQHEGTGITVLQGIRSIAADKTEVLYTKGCGIRDESRENFTEAIHAAGTADVAVLVLGGSSARDFKMSFESNGAVDVSENPLEMDCGEGVDVADLELGGVQIELAKKVVATGTPVIAILIQGRPHAIPWIAEHCDAVLCAWYPGKEGGRAIAESLWGLVNPSGKLPVSIPRSSAQLPVYYNHKGVSDYLDMVSTPLYPFGFGLSYTNFEYGSITLSDNDVFLEELEKHKTVMVSVDVRNIGETEGAEVVQVYIKGLQAGITRRVLELKGFKKVWLKPGEKKTVVFSLGKEELGVWNRDMQFVIEPGCMKIMTGRFTGAPKETFLKIKSSSGSL